MTSHALGSLFLFLFVTLVLAHVLGQLFTRFKQPRVIGEILAGVLVGPALLGHFWTLTLPGAAATGLPLPLELCYQIGLILLMFLSGAETQHLFKREDQRATAWLALVGTAVPFIVAVAACSFFALGALAGAAASRTALMLVIGIAVAVTSIPVISRIFYDLGILKTRFAKLVLGVAVIEDVVLWAVLAIATALAKQHQGSPTQMIVREIALTIASFGFGLTVAPRLLKRLRRAKWNVLAQASPAAHLLLVLFAYVALAAFLDINIVFAAFLAGFSVPQTANEKDKHYRAATESIHTLSFALLIPLYFALVGYKLNLKTISPVMIAGFLVIACSIKLVAVWLGARGAGFRGRSAINLAVATNARGGPGIVLASVAFDAGIISAPFYTTLIIAAIVTSQAAGAWLEFVIGHGWKLLDEPALRPIHLPLAPDAAASPEEDSVPTAA